MNLNYDKLALACLAAVVTAWAVAFADNWNRRYTARYLARRKQSN